MEIIIHVTSHLLNPEDSEEQIVEKSVTLTKMLWSLGYTTDCRQ